MKKDVSNNKLKLIIPSYTKIKPPLLLCNGKNDKYKKNLFRNNAYNHIYTMNRFKSCLDNRNVSRTRNVNFRRPIRRDMFKQWVQNIDNDYKKKFIQEDFYAKSKNFELYPEKKRLPPIVEKEKININVELNNLDDLISLANKYPIKFNIEYNINMEAIHNIKNNHTNKEFTNRIFETMKNNPAFMNGFYKSLHTEEKLLKSFKKNILTKLDEENMKIHHPDCHRDLSFIVDDEQED